MKNLRIGIKLLITFAIIIILFCATVATAIYGLKENAKKYSQFYNLGYQITNKVNAIIVCGTTGESATMTSNEKKELISYAIKKINKRNKKSAFTGFFIYTGGRKT